MGICHEGRLGQTTKEEDLISFKFLPFYLKIFVLGSELCRQESPFMTKPIWHHKERDTLMIK
jgi:hypothetical protein